MKFSSSFSDVLHVFLLFSSGSLVSSKETGEGTRKFLVDYNGFSFITLALSDAYHLLYQSGRFSHSLDNLLDVTDTSGICHLSLLDFLYALRTNSLVSVFHARQCSSLVSCRFWLLSMASWSLPKGTTILVDLPIPLPCLFGIVSAQVHLEKTEINILHAWISDINLLNPYVSMPILRLA